MKSRRYHRRLKARPRHLRRMMRRNRRRQQRGARYATGRHGVPFNIWRKYQCPGTTRFANMIRGGCHSRHHERETNMGEYRDSVGVKVKDGGSMMEDAALLPILFAMAVVSSTMSFIAHILHKVITIVKNLGSISVLGVALLFMLQASAASPPEYLAKDDGWKYDVSQIQIVVGVLAVLLVAVSMVTMGGMRGQSERTESNMQENASAMEVDEELGGSLRSFECGRCSFCSTHGVDSGPEHESLWSAISKFSSGVNMIVCPIQKCRTENWCCFDCGGKWYTGHEECKRRKKGPKAVADAHECDNDGRQAKRLRSGKDGRIMAEGNASGEDGPIMAEGVASGPSLFKCYDYKCACTSSRGVDCSPPHKQLWDAIAEKSGTTAAESVAEVYCPGCKTKAFQCCHCDYRVFASDPKTQELTASSQKSPSGLVKRHAEFFHRDKLVTQDADAMCQECDVSSIHSYYDEYTDTQRESTEHGNFFAGVFGDDTEKSNTQRDSTDDSNMPMSWGGASDFPGHEEMSDGSDDSDEEPDDNDEIELIKALLQAHISNADVMEEDEAYDYVQNFDHLDLDNNKCDDDEEYLENYEPLPFSDSKPPDMDYESDKQYEYRNFVMYDFRLDKEKKMQGSLIERFCQNQLYFFQKYLRKLKHRDNDRGGFEGLVGRSQVGDREDRDEFATPEETELGYRLFDLVVQMKGSLSERFCKYNKAWWKFFGVGREFKDTRAKVPKDMDTLRKHFTVGANSILKNFPAPRVYEIAHHACVNLKEVFLLYAGHGARYCFRQENGSENTEGLNGTSAMEALFAEIHQRMETAGVEERKRKQTKIGYLLFWSDSFLNSFIKQKDNSVWVLTVTICPPENMKSSGRYTYVLAMGKSDADHSEVINHYMEEAEKLMSGFDCYFGSTNKIEHVALGMLCWSADRPEQQSITHTRKEGHYGRVTGWAVNVSQEYLPSCKRCYKALIASMVGVNVDEIGDVDQRQCNNCCNWSFETNPVKSMNGVRTELQCSDRPGKQYPSTYPENAPEKMPAGREAGMDFLPPIQLSRAWVLQAIRCGYYGVRLGNWKRPTIEEYFKTCNIKTLTAVSVFEIAEKHKEIGTLDPSAAVPNVLENVDCWDRFRFPNLPMHGLGHGMIPDVMEIVHCIFKKYKMMTKFITFANKILTDVASFRLDYCKLKILPKAAWVGENSMGYMRLMSYLYGMFLLNQPLGQSEEARITTVFLKCFINSFQAYVSVLMSSRPVDKDLLNRHMKLFMSSAHYLHKFHGNLDRKKNDEDGPGKKSNLGKKPPKFMETQSETNLRRIAQKLGIEGITEKATKTDLINKFKKCTVEQLLGMISDLNEKEPNKANVSIPAGKKKLKKDDLIRLVHETFVEPECGDGDEGPEEWNGVEKAENMCWVRGNWLSFMANIVRQTSFLGQLHLVWEGRNELQIGHVKKILVSMRKDQKYRETKMRLLHKLLGIEWLDDAFDDEENNPRNWFKGHFKYEDLNKITDRLVEGRPISCAVSKDDDTQFFVSFCSGSQESIKYVTLAFQPSTNFEEEMGVQFCKFNLISEAREVVVKTVTKRKFQDLIGGYALMLPYMKEGGYRQNFTLVYHDWDVLECTNDTNSRKGHPVAARGVFSEEYKNLLDHAL